MLFLGVDGGQSSTTALIADETGKVLGTGTGGPCNHVGAAEGAAKLKRVLLDCVLQACVAADLNPSTVQFKACCFGMSGGPADKRQILSEILRTDLLVVTDDAVIALAGALGGKPGVVTIAGTGSISYGRNEVRSARAGGWGYVFGDEGGAFSIVRDALRAALRVEEGWGPATLLKDELLKATGLAEANETLHAFYTSAWPRARVAALAPLVSRIAEAGDPVATSILHDAASHLASQANAVRNQLWPSEKPVQFSYIGGVFQSPIVLTHFCAVLNTAPPLLGAAHGALLEAYRAAGITPNPGKLLSSVFEHG